MTIFQQIINSRKSTDGILYQVSKEDYNQQKKVTMTIWVIFSIILISGAWILREYKHEKYDYNYAIQNGKLVGGTVYASYPEQVGGLGWVL